MLYRLSTDELWNTKYVKYVKMKVLKGYWRDKRTSNYENWTDSCGREPNRTLGNEKKNNVIMKSETSLD